jgi:hypothetical protein
MAIFDPYPLNSRSRFRLVAYFRKDGKYSLLAAAGA